MSEPLAVELREMALLSNARRMLAEARTLDAIKDIRDKAEALRMYVKQQGEGLESQNAAAEIKLRAERRAGKILLDINFDKGGGDQKSDHRSPERTGDLVRLSETGLSKKQSSQWQCAAKFVSDEDFEEHMESVKDSGKELTSVDIFKLAKQREAQQPVEPDWSPKCGGDVVKTLGELIKAGRKFKTIYADPPWQYGNQGTRASTDNHYGTMDLDAICAEPVAQIVEDDAHLHLWTTNAFLFDARRVIESWGFTYKSCFIWVKPQMGIGNYWRVSHEFLLFGIRGKLPFRTRDEMSWMNVPRGEHSSKPDVFRMKVEKVSPGPYLEMYGRADIPNSAWTVYGNQISRRLF